MLQRIITSVFVTPHPTPTTPNPAGALTVVSEEDRSQRRGMYWALLPTLLLGLASEAGLTVDDDGFLTTPPLDRLAPFTSPGALLVEPPPPDVALPLSQVKSVSLRAGEARLLRLALAGGDTLVLECGNAEDAFGWQECLRQQVTRATAAAAAAAGVTAAAASTAAAAAAVPTPPMSPAVGGRSSFTSFFGSRGGGGGGGTKSSPPASPIVTGSGGPGTPSKAPSSAAASASYVMRNPWSDRGIDLTARRNERLWQCGGAPAAVCCGLLTKRNKSGLRAGSAGVEKERFFVLTPETLAYFPDEVAARVDEGYMHGEARGERISGLWTKTGASLPLEAVCSVSYGLADGSDGSGGGASGGGAGGGSGAAAPPPATPSDDPAALRSTYFEVDFGTFTLQLNGHSPATTLAWVAAIRKWAAIRRGKVDTAMLHNMGGGFV